MNTASAHGRRSACALRDLWVESDAGLDPSAYVLRPDVALDIAGQIVAEPTPYLRTRRAAQPCWPACARLRGRVFPLTKLETRWLDRLSSPPTHYRRTRPNLSLK